MVAEGVETVAEADVLRSLGVDLGQGWHFGRPAVPETPVPTPRDTGDLPSAVPVPR